VVNRKGEHHELFIELRAKGFVRLRVDGQVVEMDNLPTLAKNSKHNIDVVIDRFRVRPDAQQRLAESFETACRMSLGRAIVQDMDTGVEQLFSARFACPTCDYSLSELEPRLFSFNSPQGACPSCDGLGVMSVFEASRVVANPTLSLSMGAIKGWDKRNHFYYQLISALATHYDFDLEQAWEQLPKPVQDVILFGSGEEVLSFIYYSEKGYPQKREHAFEGVIPNMERRYRETDSNAVREELNKYRGAKPCTVCGGSRLRLEARHVLVGDTNIQAISEWTLKATQQFFDSLKLVGSKAQIGERIVREIANRLRFLNDVGLQYLALSRRAETLSGGESQRIRLASQIGSGLTGVMYVLDEPSIGLHQRDNDRLLATLRHLRNLGNTVIVVEHDEDAINAADYVIDMGPGAGVHGGLVIAEGKPADIRACPNSITGLYLSGQREIAVPKQRSQPGEQFLTITQATGNNLRGVDLSIPLGLFVCVTGVSGSGKSTLVNDTLYHSVSRHLYGSNEQPAPFEKIDGLKLIDKVINVDQSPIGRTPRSNPATYTGLFTPIRELYAQTMQARERGYEAGRFSFNVKGGRCEACEGDGVKKVEMHFLPDVYVTCDVCHGKRYNRETLDVEYKGKNIEQVLSMTVEAAAEFFSAVPLIARKLNTLMAVGLGYIRLGQSATTLSGGEAQRVKLSQELSKRDTGHTLYILDEPTTGLHFEDIALLLKVLQELKSYGNTIVVIEHNLDVIKTADWIIDMGPEGGSGGGQIIAQGPPEAIAQEAASYTGRYLKSKLTA
jgi:excinuclease ABC subunit A